jgi:hypothetical protein
MVDTSNAPNHAAVNKHSMDRSGSVTSFFTAIIEGDEDFKHIAVLNWGQFEEHTSLALGGYLKCS